MGSVGKLGQTRMNEWNAGERCRGVAAGGGEWKVSHCNGADRLLFPVVVVRAKSDQTNKITQAK